VTSSKIHLNRHKILSADLISNPERLQQVDVAALSE
jgi:hypothetical protein